MIMPMIRYPFKNIENFRDLGGLPAGDGGMTRWGVFYRSAGLENATAEEMDYILNRMNIHTIIDLRVGFEIEAMPDPFMSDPRFRWIHHSLIGDIDFSEDLGIDKHTPNTPTLVNFYKTILSRCEKEFKTLMTLLKEGTDEGAVLFHCAAGKDRTGLTAMFLQSLSGVSDKDIISQYEISRTLLTGYRINDISGSHYANMEVLLNFIHEKYGTPTGYLTHAGVSKQTLDDLKNALYQPIPEYS